MIYNPKTGKIAYHVIRFRENGTGSDFVQYDFEGKELYSKPYSEYTTDIYEQMLKQNSPRRD